MLLWRCDFQWFKVPRPEVKEGNVDKMDWETTVVNLSGKLPLGFHRSRRDIEEAAAFSLLLCAGKANLTGPWEHRDEDSTLPLPAPTWLHCTTLIHSGLALFIPLPHTQLYNSFSARSRRTSHGPRADCSFRLAIFELTRSTAFQPQEERRTASVLPFSRPRRSHLPVQNDFLGKGGTLCGKQYVQWVCEVNAKFWPDFGGLGLLFFLFREPNNQYTLQDFSSAFSRPWQAQTCY